MTEISPDLIKGIYDICNYVGEHKNDFSELVNKEGLPAFQRKKDGTWRSLRPRLDKWLTEQDKKYQAIKAG